jgi:heptaprenyl diphosphate synthase
VINLHDIQTKLAEMKELIEQRAYHPYLINNIKAPLIDEDKILLLLSIFDQLNLTDIEKNTYITATMLIQLALDTHDFVSTDSINEDLKGQQLTVLAGDYFSGLYYKHLASINNVSLIRELSQGIKDINEQKILLHEQHQINDMDQLLNRLKIIEGALFEKIADFFHVSIWNEFTMNFLLVNRLLREKEKFLMTDSSIGFDAVKGLNGIEEIEVKKKNILYVFNQGITRSIHLMNLGAENVPNINELLKMRIQTLVDEHQTMVKTFVEEG